MELTFLGTGTSNGVPMLGCSCPVCQSTDPKDTRQRTSALLSIGTKKILFDSGPDIRQQFLQNHITHIDALLMTHEHYDHLIGLDELRPLTWHDKLPIFAEERVISHMKNVFSYLFSDPIQIGGGLTNINVQEIKATESFFIDEIEILPIRVHHGRLPILGFKIGNLAYLTDVKTLPQESIELLKGVDTLVISCLRERAHETHLNREEMLAYVSEIKPRLTYLIHMEHSMFHEEWLKILPENIIPAYDGLKITIPDTL
ncbi:MAG: MBL fold metallo-hydrolase [Brevinema sp.]